MTYLVVHRQELVTPPPSPTRNEQTEQSDWVKRRQNSRPIRADRVEEEINGAQFCFKCSNSPSLSLSLRRRNPSVVSDNEFILFS